MNAPVTLPVETPGNHASGFVSIIGRPNAGKSTLMNALLGSKLAIVADKPQTTRNIIQGVLTLPEAQVIFLDTPGIHQAKTLLHKRMLEMIRTALEGRDLILFLADATSSFHPHDEQALQWLKDVETPTILVLNKIDALKSKADLLPLMERYGAARQWEEVIPISALTGDGLDILLKAVISRLPKGPRYFPEDHLTGHPERFIASEFIREKILNLTREEVPHSVAVVIETWVDEPRKDGGVFTKILAAIHVERDGQKAIIIGERGAMLKQIGTQARLDLEALLERKIYLELFVRVTPDWRQRAQFLNELEQSAVSKLE